MTQLAVIDIGTFTCRLALASWQDSAFCSFEKFSTICDLGAGVDASGKLDPSAIKRVLSCVDNYGAHLLDASSKQGEPVPVCCTLTSAARDAANAQELLEGLAARGLKPCVIPGEVEGSLSFLGVAQDFYDERIMVADNGGGSTELAVGSSSQHELSLEWVYSVDMGCRRATDRYLAHTSTPNLREARLRIAELFSQALERAPFEELPHQLVVVGGTATSLIALDKKLVPYDASAVHLASLSLAQLDYHIAQLAQMDEAAIANLPGLQPKRASVILGGALVLAALLDASQLDVFTVSENDLLKGLCLAGAAELEGRPFALAWEPSFGFVQVPA